MNSSKHKLAVIVVVIAVVLASFYFLSGSFTTPQTTTSQSQANSQTQTPLSTGLQSQTPQSTMAITSPAFADGAIIPQKYTCQGDNTSPPLSWSDPPLATKSFALILSDPDAPGGVFTHWVIFNIPATETSLQAAIQTTGALPDGAMQGRNSSNKLGYTGPCPPSGTHHYVFQLYALDTTLDLSSGASKQELLSDMQGHILAQAQLIGLYSKS